jgi:hypothetical protein
VILKPLVDLHGEPNNWASAVQIYIEALADIPPELLRAAVRHAIAANPYFPKPAELRASIADELQSYWRRRREEMPTLPKPEDRPPPSPEDIAHVKEAMRQIRGILSHRATSIRGN